MNDMKDNSANSHNVTNSYDLLTATQLSKGLREGRWTSVDLTRHFLGKIKERNHRVHAVVGVEERAALDQAAASDCRRATGNALSPLDGMPMTVKDAFRMKGCLSTYGFWMFRNYRPQNDCQVIEVLRRNGVVFMGRTAVPTGSFDWNCKNQIHEECVNPVDPSRTPGGSSGGAAAALAQGMTPLEIGSDFHGSLRYPAHCCGVYSLRTTDGWLPIEDIGPESYPTTFKRIATVGPMARNLEDLQLMLTSLAEAFPLPAAGSASSTTKLNVAYSKQLLGRKPDHTTLDLFDRMLTRLSDQGHEVCETAPAFDWDALEQDFGMIGGHEFSSVLPKLLRNNLVKSMYARFGLQSRIGKGPFMANFKRGMLASEAQYEAALKRREQVLAETEHFFSQYDLWMLPVAPSVAIPRSLCGKKIPTSDGDIEYLSYLGPYLGATSLLGTPALTVPIGRDQAGLPMGVQIHGRRFSDRRLVQMVGEFSI